MRHKPRKAIHVSAALSPLPGILSCGATCSRTAGWTCIQWTGHFNHGASCRSKLARALRFLPPEATSCLQPGPTLLAQDSSRWLQPAKPANRLSHEFPWSSTNLRSRGKRGVEMQGEVSVAGGHPTGGGLCALSRIRFQNCSGHRSFSGLRFGYEKAKGLSCKLRGKPAESSRKRRKRVAS